MFSHITIGTSDVPRAQRFFSAVLTPLGLVQKAFEADRVRFGSAGEDLPFFTVLLPIDDQAASPGNGTMVAFVASDRKAVDAAYAAAIEAGGTCAGRPGLRPDYGTHYYGAYFRDPDGNKLHVVSRTEEDGA